MVEGFDVALEMSGHPTALPDVIANLNHGGRIAMLGLPSTADRDRLGPGGHPHAHDQGHLRPRDVRDLVRDERDAALGPRHRARSSPTASPPRDWAEAFATARGGAVRQGRPRLDGGLIMYGTVWRRSARDAGRDPRGRALQARARARLAAVVARVSSAARDVLNFCANNYLGLADHPAVVAAAAPRARRVGLRDGQRALHLRHADPAHRARAAAVGRSSAPRRRSCTRPASTPTAACSRCCSTSATR